MMMIIIIIIITINSCNTVFPRDIVCLRNMSINTLYKGDDDDDDDNNNNKGSRGMGEVAPLYGVDSALVLTNPGVQ